jgi:hypothetical protein
MQANPCWVLRGVAAAAYAGLASVSVVSAMIDLLMIGLQKNGREEVDLASGWPRCDVPSRPTSADRGRQFHSRLHDVSLQALATRGGHFCF